MTVSGAIIPVQEMSTDARVRVFRRTFTDAGEYEGMEVDNYVVLTERYAVVFDTLLCPEDMADLMQMVQPEQRQLLVVNSHADWDHAWGNCYFTGGQAAPIIAHKHGLARLQSEEAHAELAEFQQKYSAFRNVVLTPPTLTFTTNMSIHDGDLTIELLHAPGHHTDHIMAWLPDLSLLLAFDTVEMPVPILENAHSVQSMYDTLHHILNLHPQRVLCSHGKTTSSAIVQRNLDYLHEIERRSQLALAHHKPTQEDLEHPETYINYPFDEVIADIHEPIDRTFYTWAHNHNIRCVIEWLLHYTPTKRASSIV